MIDETKIPVVTRDELTSGLQLIDTLLARLQEMRGITVTLLSRPGDEIMMTHREGIRMFALRDEIGDMVAAGA